MKKRTKVTAIIISLIIIVCLCSVTAFAVGTVVAEGEIDSSVFEDEMISEFFGLWIFIIIASLFSSLSLPAIIVMVIFIIKNSNAKKDLAQYEKLFGPLEAYNNVTSVVQPVPQPINTLVQQPVSSTVTEGTPNIEPANMTAPASENNQGGNM